MAHRATGHDDIDEENFGLIRPSLIRQLRAILDQYPDDGQILKELIQNAEDAGARTVTFLYDQHSYGTTSLHHPNLAAFQGPAIYAYNDAVFSQEDWRGIRMLQDSIKENDPMKVGRFGLGFKSVLHMTDLPSVLSGNRLFIIDPHEKYFRVKGNLTSGYTWNLATQKKEVSRLQHQFDPYRGLFNCSQKSFDKGHFDGTMFRFPIRQKASPLSDHVYTHKKVMELFSSFKSNAYLVLVFLKHLEEIVLCRRAAGQAKSRSVFSVRIAKSCLETVRRHRSQFLADITSNSTPEASIKTTYFMEVEKVEYKQDGSHQTDVCRLLVTEMYGGGDVSVELKRLQQDPKLGFMPLVGAAMELKQSWETEDKPEPRRDVELCGQVFCILPLAVEQKSSTGLPVHINGYFAVSQNRRHLRWPSTGQTISSDKTLRWNQCLLSQLVPECYVELVTSAIRSSQSSTTLSVQDVYAAVPDLEKVDEKWSIVLKPFFVQLFTQNAVFHTDVDGGKWIPTNQAVFDCLTEDTATRKQVVDVLLAANIPVVTVPVHFVRALGQFTSFQPQEITPTFVRSALRHSLQAYDNLKAKQKLLLLHYLLKDQDFRDLADLKLLPLANGEFTYFRRSMETVFLGNEEFPRNLLPGLEHRLLADDLNEGLMRTLIKVVDGGCHQLRHLDSRVMVDLIKEVIPKSWYKTGLLRGREGRQNDPFRAWLQRLWIYLRRQHHNDLSPFLGLPLLPLGDDKVVSLTLPSLLILRSEYKVKLSPGLSHCLELVGITVVDGLAEHVRCHAAVVRSFVRPPLPENVVDVIFAASRKVDVVTVFRDQTTEEEKLELLELIGRIGRQSVEVEQMKFLRALPIFKSTRSTSDQPQFVSAAEVKKAHASHSIVTLEEAFIDVSTRQAMSAATTLRVEILNDVSFIKGHVLPEIRNRRLKPEDVQRCMHYVFDNIQVLQRDDPQLLLHLVDIPFVTTKAGDVVSPSSVYDPTDATLQTLFVGEDNHFPDGFYATPESLIILQKMGMKTASDVSAHDILYTTKQIETMSNTLADDTKRKAEALLTFLTDHTVLLREKVNGKQLVDWLKDIAWVPVCTDMLEQFPVDLKVDAGEMVHKASDVKSYDWASIVGRVVPIVQCRAETTISKLFGWDTAPSLDDVVGQFKLVVASYSFDATADYTAIVRKTYTFLSKQSMDDVQKALEGAELSEWVWHGEGFTAVERALLQSPPLPLTPYVYTLPKVLQQFHSLLSGCGVMPHCSNEVLVRVLHAMKTKYSDRINRATNCSDEHNNEAGGTNTPNDNEADNVVNDEEVESDIRLAMEILRRLEESHSLLVSDLVGAIQQLKDHDGDAKLSGSKLQLAVMLATCLRSAIEHGKHQLCDVQDEHGTIFLPNERGVLHPTTALFYNERPTRANDVTADTPMKNDETSAVGGYTHPTLPRMVPVDLGVRTVESEMLRKYSHGIPFGQEQDLTTSLSRILDSYPLNYEILKELIQNADDAGATEIHFVNDSRHHSDKAVFAPCWKPLQGPALCVYNNRPFTEADLKGIQKLGEGSKAHDSSKTGQYGIGFSALYHLTDTPCVLTQLVGKNKSLCVFDPNLRYVPGANPSKPGMRFDVSDVQDRFPDVFSCYLPQCFDVDNATLFRFPLRTPKMAEKSQISHRSVDPEKLQSLLDQLKQEACESLLFTNNITKISISMVDHHTGKLVNTYVARAELSKEHTKWKSELAVVRRTAAQTEGADRLRNVPLREVMSTLVINDTNGVSEKWCVSEQLGIEPHVEVPKCVAHAIRNGELRLLPQGGIACLLEYKHSEIIETTRKKRSVFCFLPLPIETTLPVHVNGHFALGYENRRTLWDKADRDSYKTDWNEFLCREVIAPCYVRLLTAVRANFLKTDVDENERMVLSRSRRDLDDAVAAHQSQLPTFDEKQPDWDILVKAVYERCATTDAPVFPSVLPLEDKREESSSCCINWLPATGSGDQKAFFTNESELQIEQVLVTSGMKLVIAQPALVESLNKTALPVEVLSAKNLMSFFASYAEDSSSCELGELPMPIGKSVFMNADTLHSVLEYCSEDPQFVSRLDGAPLLLTADNMLRVFDSDTPVYHSHYTRLAPHSKDRFLHDYMRQGVFVDFPPADAVQCQTRNDPDTNNTSTDVFSSFTIKALANLLDNEFPLLHNTRGFVKWSCQDNSLPGKRWLGDLWNFIHSQMMEKNGQIPGHMSSIKACLSPLSQWCLIAARDCDEPILVSIDKASSSIIDLHNVRDKEQLLDKVLRKMKLPELDLASMTTTFAIVDIDDLVRSQVATVDMPHRILSVAHTYKNRYNNTLNATERRDMLTYFCDNLQDLQKNDNYVNHLKDMSLYTTVCGGVIHLTGSVTYMLPKGIPKDGMDAWNTNSGIVFLWQNKSLAKLYEAIGCASLTHGHVYCDFIFKHLEYLSSEMRWRHLKYIYTNFMKTPQPRNSAISDTDRGDVVADLRALPILDHGSNGDLQPVSFFFDSHNEVFRVMLPDDMLSPQPPSYLFSFSPLEWADFLCQLGLQCEFTPGKFSKFAKEVAQEGATNSKSKQTAHKSRILVEHMFSMKNTNVQRAIMKSVVDVAFVPEARVETNGRYICFRDSLSMRHADITWTQAKLLPDWADPDSNAARRLKNPDDVKRCLGIADNPPVQMVARHLLTLCETETLDDNDFKQKVFRSIYDHLQTHGLEDPDVRRILSNTPCALMKDGSVVFANQTVVNILDTDEIRPYLYRFPLSLGAFSALFQALGATERPTACQYCNVLTHLHTPARDKTLHPNELLCAKKAIAGLVNVLKEGSLSPDVPTLFLLSDTGTLVPSTRLFFNDAPAYRERAGALPGLQFMARVQGCGDSSPEKSLRKLPAALQPQMLSSVVSERLMSHCKLSGSTDSLATRLGTRLQSSVFLDAIDRLARHEAHRRGIDPDPERIADATNRLSMINVHGVVGDVVTELVYRDKPVDGSQLRKACFVEKPNQPELVAQWHVYVSSAAELSLDLLVPLADVINEIMSGLLKDVVLYLLPVISCPSEADIAATLNNLNVREYLVAEGIGLDLQAGDPIPATTMACLRRGERDFVEGEYVGYQEDDSQPVVYGIVKEQRLSPSDSSTYLVTIGESVDVIAGDVQLYKFVRIY